MPRPDAWPIRGEDVAFADSAATRKEESESFLVLVAAESAHATSSPLIDHDSSHGISDTYHRSG